MLITKQEIANEAKDRWKMQYFENGAWKLSISGDTEVVYNNLVSLGDNPAPNLVDAAIGNSSWTHLGCSECNTDVDEVVLFGVVEFDS